MTRYTWTHDGDVWQLHVPGREASLYNVASRWQPRDEDTVRILLRLVRFYPWLAEYGRRAA